MLQLQRFAAILILSIGALLAASPEARAEQCVFNRGGFVIHVHWYRIGTLAFRKGGGTLHALADPVRSNVLALDTGACNKSDENLIAAVHVVGCYKILLSGVDLSNCSLASMAHVERSVPVAVFDTDGYGNRVWFHPRRDEKVSGPVVDGPYGCLSICNYSVYGFPPTSPAWIGVPPTTRYLDFSGTVFDVQYGPGGPI